MLVLRFETTLFAESKNDDFASKVVERFQKVGKGYELTFIGDYLGVLFFLRTTDSNRVDLKSLPYALIMIEMIAKRVIPRHHAIVESSVLF